MSEEDRAQGMFISEYQKTFENKGNIDYIDQRTSDGMVTDAGFFAMLPEVQTIECRGAVHNYRVHRGWKEQADKFLELSSGKGFKKLNGDYEDYSLSEQSAKDFFCFLSYIKQQRPNKKITFYTTIYKLRDYMIPFQGKETEFGPIDWSLFDFWLARYYGNIDPNTTEPSLSINNVKVWDTWTFWQYWADGNEKGKEYGVGSTDANLDVFNGTVPELRVWYGLEDPPTPPPGNCCDEIESLKKRIFELEKKSHWHPQWMERFIVK